MSTPLRGGELGLWPFVSPDGAWVGFTADGILRKVPILGGISVTLTDPPGVLTGATWGSDDQIIMGIRDGGLFRVSGIGQAPETLTILDTEQGETSHTGPSIIRGRDAVLFVIGTGPILTTGQLAVLDLNSGHITRLGLAGVSPHYVSTGHLVYAAADGSVQAVAFDAASLEVTGNPVTMVEDVMVKSTGAAYFSVSDNGLLVYVLAPGLDTQRSVVWVDRQGREEPVVGQEPGGYRSLRLSPNGRQLALDINPRASSGGVRSLWMHDVRRGVTTPLTPESGMNDQHPLWTPDGERVVSSRDGSLFWTLADGTGVAEELLNRQGETLYPESWAPDGRLLFQAIRGGLANIEALSMADDRTVEALLQTEASPGGPIVSPDGQWLAYHSNLLAGRYEIYLARFPLLGDRRQISTTGGRVPLWSPDGSELFYKSLDGREVMKVTISTEPTLTVGTPERLFDGDYLPATGTTRPWNLTPDGQRFVIIKADPRSAAAAPNIHVVLNWTQELRERVP